MEYKVRDIVETTSRRGLIIGVIASLRTIQRGRRAGMTEYTVAPLNQDGVYMLASGDTLRLSERSYTDDEINAALNEQSRVVSSRHQNQHASKQRQRTAQDELGDVIEGDIILIKSKDGGRWKGRVVGVNRDTGKVAIEASGYRAGKRWIPSTAIAEVTQPEESCPVKITEMVVDDLQKYGWAQVRVGREFIERSYLIAFTKRDAATKRHDFECPSKVVHFDPELKLYWRSTGSFD